MKITPFITIYKTKEKRGDARDFIKEHLKTEYVPYETKADVAKAIIDSSYYRKVKDANKREYTEFHIDSVAKYMLSRMAIIDLFTNIERQKTDGKMLEDFNKLNELGLIDEIIECINPREIQQFEMILQMTAEDAITNEYEPHAFIKNQVERFGNLVGATLGPILQELDIDKIKETITQAGEKQ